MTDTELHEFAAAFAVDDPRMPAATGTLARAVLRLLTERDEARRIAQELHYTLCIVDCTHVAPLPSDWLEKP